MKAYALKEGLFSVDHTKIFAPFDPSKDHIEDRPAGSVPLAVQPFLVITDEDIILLDTGLGYEREGELQLFSNLRAYGIQPEEVTKVLMSHLHKDHIGGMMRHVDAKGYQFNFPNAIYYIQEKELEYALSANTPSFNKGPLLELKNHAQVQFLNGDGNINELISYQVSGGHTPFHQVFWIRENDETIFYGADVAPMLFQLRNHINAKYDFDGKKAMNERTLWWQQGQQAHWTFLFYHDIKQAIFQA